MGSKRYQKMHSSSASEHPGDDTTASSSPRTTGMVQRQQTSDLIPSTTPAIIPDIYDGKDHVFSSQRSKLSNSSSHDERSSSDSRRGSQPTTRSAFRRSGRGNRCSTENRSASVRFRTIPLDDIAVNIEDDESYGNDCQSDSSGEDSCSSGSFDRDDDMVASHERQSHDHNISSIRSDNSQQAGKSRGWKILRKHLRKGTLVLEARDIMMTCGDENDTCTRTISNSSSSLSAAGRSNKSIRNQIVGEIQKGQTLSIQTCLLAIGMYLIFSICIFSFILEPSWTIIDSCYFAVATFTTLGYGDLTPSGSTSRIVTCAFALLGVGCLGLTLGVLGKQIIENHEIAAKGHETQLKEDVMTMFGTGSRKSYGTWNEDNGGDGVTETDTTFDVAQASKPTTTTTAAVFAVETTNSDRSIISQLTTQTSLSSTWIGKQVNEATNKWSSSAWNFRNFLILGIVLVILVYRISISAGWDVVDTIYAAVG